MAMLLEGCGAERRDSEVTRAWWEPPYVTYGISHRRVRSWLERMVNTYVVRATDKRFMSRLQERVREDHLEELRRRILQREEGELEREKRLILEGRMKVEEAPEELANHPVFKINKMVEERRHKAGTKKRSKKLKRFNYDLVQGIPEEVEEDFEMKSCVDSDDDVAEIIWKLKDKEDSFAEGKGFTDEDYFRIKYEDSLVGEMMELEKIDDLYEVADEAVGLLEGRKCGGLTRQLGTASVSQQLRTQTEQDNVV